MNFKTHLRLIVLVGALWLADGFSLALVRGGEAPRKVRRPAPAFNHLAPLPPHGPGQKVRAPRPVRLRDGLRDQHWIELNLAPDVTYWAVREHLTDLGDGDFVWSGRVKDQPVSRVSLSIRQGVAAGTVVIPTPEGAESYVLEPAPGGDSWLRAAHGTAGDGEPVQPPPLPAGDGEPPATATNPAVVNLMVLYTPATRTRWGLSGIESKIAEAMAYSNQGYANSGVYLTLNLVHTAEVDYTESGSQSQTLDHLTFLYDGQLDEVHALRDQYAADLVVLISEDSSGCGLAWVMDVVTTAFADYAFAVVWSSCLNASNLSFPHEIGHLLGCQHDRANASFQGAFPYSYGHRRCVLDGSGWRTLMSYDCGGVTRINYYSTPDLTYGGNPLGIRFEADPANAAENARSINNTAHTVENFRQPPATPPAAPSGLTATANAFDRIALGWVDHASDELAYKIERSPNGNDAWSETASVPANTVAYLDTAVGGSTTYYYRVRAFNAAGYSAYSGVASATTPAGPPTAPSNLTATGFSNSEIDLAWIDTSSVETAYRVERSPDGGSWTEIAVLPANATTYRSGGLAGATTFYYRVRASNSAGVSEYSNVASAATLPDPVQPPAAPTSLNATPLSYSQIELTWTDNAHTELGFKVERSPNGLDQWAQITTVGANVTHFADTGLPANSTSHYRVRAYNSGGDSAYSNTANATTPANLIAAPSGLAATAISCSEIHLTWTDNAATETGFELERSLDGASGWTPIGLTPANTATFANPGLSPSTPYWYRVRAVNDGGASAWSNVASAITPSDVAAPSGLVATALSFGLISLNWTDNSSSEVWQEIERSPNGSAGWTVIGEIGPDVRSFTDAGLAPLTRYYYRVRAQGSGAASAFSNTASATTPVQPPISATVSSVAGEDGYVLESGETSNLGGSVSAGKGYVGDSNKDCQYKSIVSFDTAGIPDNATILAATVRLSVAAFSGTPCFQTHGACRVDLKAGSGFNGSPALAKADFAAPADGVGVATLGIATSAGQWSEGTLSTGALALVNKTGRTQFRVYFQSDDNDDAGTDYVSFNTAAASTPSLRPQLVLQYMSSPTLPLAPSGLEAEPLSITQITLTWTENAGNESGLRLERSTDGVTWLTIATLGANTTSYLDSGLVTGATYFYRLLAYNDAGYSGYTGLASAVPQTPPITLTLRSVGAEDGYVLESGETTSAGGSVKTGMAYVGDSSKDCQYRSVFSFDTAAIPDGARVLSAKLRLLRTGVSGTNPFDTHGDATVDVKGGTGFGGATALTVGDFQAAADALAAGTLSNATANDSWSEARLVPSALGFINKTGRTQFRVGFALDDNDDRGNDYLIYATGSHSTAANRPQLVIQYNNP